MKYELYFFNTFCFNISIVDIITNDMPIVNEIISNKSILLDPTVFFKNTLSF